MVAFGQHRVMLLQSAPWSHPVLDSTQLPSSDPMRDWLEWDHPKAFVAAGQRKDWAGSVILELYRADVSAC